MDVCNEVLKKLRSLMKQCEPHNLQAYIIPTDDAHQNEYICQHDARRTFVSGFDGSSGTAVVTLNRALMWTDGRYYQQAEKQMNTNWELMRDGIPETPSVGKWLSNNLPKGSDVGVDPKLISYRQWKPIQKELISSVGSKWLLDEYGRADLSSFYKPNVRLKYTKMMSFH
ncbi:xaa-Pro aminopeptidase ApepP-like [Rhagoletis pomonella]|uniref:xaa-Pro aminopeptidase ApepP-like n=1 Tax=Rhagoletis pomonella TaxID=28610 RepID=UPI00177E9993|nr:xaa-Pro aminopeptidase ApepP-like [Rhagoletis pomonella]XP_036317462.1 xaa-Pro aminopeptidase ApepP-like [Rhagoletis pomonella]